MKLSIVVSVLDSHEIVRRQVEHFKKMNLSDDVEIIIMDDGSNPPLDYDHGFKNLKIIKSGYTGKWTQGLAKNRAAKEIATGEYLFVTDIDHIITKPALDWCLQFDRDKAIFFREFGIITEDGILTQDYDALVDFGMPPSQHKRRGVHGNTWIMKRKLFINLGMYSQKRSSMGTHLMGEDREFNRRYSKATARGVCDSTVVCPYHICVFPIGKFHINHEENPFGLFHNLHREYWGETK